jgi:hypothetical protein
MFEPHDLYIFRESCEGHAYEIHKNLAKKIGEAKTTIRRSYQNSLLIREPALFILIIDSSYIFKKFEFQLSRTININCHFFHLRREYSSLMFKIVNRFHNMTLIYLILLKPKATIFRVKKTSIYVYAYINVCREDGPSNATGHK